MRNVYLTPRAVAAIVSLRGGPRTGWSVSQAICDKRLCLTTSLLARLAELGLVAAAASKRGRGQMWWLTTTGIDYLAAQGETADGELSHA